MDITRRTLAGGSLAAGRCAADLPAAAQRPGDAAPAPGVSGPTEATRWAQAEARRLLPPRRTAATSRPPAAASSPPCRSRW